MPIRVLVVEDSTVMRDLVVAVLESDAAIQVVGRARDGVEAVELAASLRPDVITMDIRMPRLDGFEATKRIMSEAPTRIVVVSSSVDAEELKITFNALRLGAVAVVEKPRAATDEAFQPVRQQLLDTVKAMADVKVVRRWPDRLPVTHPTMTAKAPAAAEVRLIAIAASTGGPAALATVLQRLPADFGVPILAVQHITRGFDRGLVAWLGSLTPLRVRLATDGDRLNGAEFLLGPNDYHLCVTSHETVALNQTAAVGGHRPSASVLFRSVAVAYGPRAVGVILTGMGEDGADGLLALREAGGQTIAQDEASSIVYGMPKSAIARGAAAYVEPLEKVADRILRLVGGSNGGRGR